MATATRGGAATRGARSGRFITCAALGCVAASLAGCTPYGGQVTRVVNGRTQTGRYVPQPAYADYSLGAYLEASGQLDQAESAYVRALADDPNSPEMWTRLGALRCRRASSAGFSAFERALALAPNYEPAWREKARCLLAAGKPAAALSAAQRGFQLDPNQEQATLLLSEIFVELGRKTDARLWLNAWVTRYPGAFAAWSALKTLADNSGNAGDRARARAALANREGQHRAHAPHPPPEPVNDSKQVASTPRVRDSLDRALDQDDLPAAQRAGIELGLPAAEVARRGYLRGNTNLARTQAALLLEADPSNSDARVILLLLGDPRGAEALWAMPDPISPALRQLLAPALDQTTR